MMNPEKAWVERPRDRQLSVGLVLLGALLTLIAYFFAALAGMAYRNSPVQDWAIIVMGFGPPLIYIAMLITTIRLTRSGKRSWHVALASCLGPVGLWFLALGVMGIDYALRVG
jgi:hypothetical protein